MFKPFQDQIAQFCSERDWDQFHDPVHLSIGVATEAAELLDIFRFHSREGAEALLEDPEKREHVEEELADVLYFVLRFSQKYGIDLERAFTQKMRKNEEKYPLEMVKGLNKKYSEY